MVDLRQVDLKQVRDEVADRVGRALSELGTGAGNVARELAASAQDALSTQTRKPVRRSRRGPSPVAVISGAVAAAIAVYFLDPERGRARRDQFVSWSGSRLRLARHALDQLRERTASSAASFPLRSVSLRSGPRPVEDRALRERVESEVFGNPELPKDQINMEVESAVVTIRGQVDNAFLIATIEKVVLAVPGVGGVENLLQVNGPPAPNTQPRENAG
jgi:hypothetical protein